VLYGAIELARDESVDGYRYLRNAIEEGAANLRLRHADAPEMEIDAFAIPVFVHSQGGLDPRPTSRTATPTTRCWTASPLPGWKARARAWCWSAMPTT
jgi:hypothetical protein